MWKKAVNCRERLPICVSWDTVQMLFFANLAWFLESGGISWPIESTPTAMAATRAGLYCVRPVLSPSLFSIVLFCFVL